MDEDPLYASVGSLFHELRGAASFIIGIYESLDQKMPEPAQGSWNDLGRISEQVLIDIEDKMGGILANIDSYVPVTASVRICDFARGWEKDAEQMSLIVDQIAGLQVQLDDPQSNTILSEYLPGSVRGFGRIVSFVMQIRPEDLLLD
jgi:hypothetical protein